LFGHSEAFLDQSFNHDGVTDYVCFTDDPELHSDFWQIVVVPKTLLDPHRRSKGFKHRPHIFFPNHEASLYIDNTVELSCEPSSFFKQMSIKNSSFMMFKHPDRNCVYDEAEVVKNLCFDDPDIINKQMDHYRKKRYPSRNGLHATTVMLRKHNDPKIKIAMTEWHSQVLRYSKRDQLSFDVVRHLFDLKVDAFEGRLIQNELMKWPVVLGAGRLPRDFDEDEYLRLNPDIQELNVIPQKHYLQFGASEGRKYKAEVGSDNFSTKTFRVDPKDDRGRELQLSKNGQLNEPTYAMWEVLLREKSWSDIIDIGANYGEMLVRASFPPSAHVIAVEPNPRIFPLLRENLHNANVKGDCLAIAISNKTGLVELCTDLRWSGLSSLEKPENDDSFDKETVLVPAMTVDTLFNDEDLGGRTVLLKIDVEGHEISVLDGMRRVATQCGDLAILVEILHLDTSARALLLENFSVEVYNLPHGSLLKVEPSSIERLDALLQSDDIYKNDVVLRLKN
jgi:FkbM family methyltransferase